MPKKGYSPTKEHKENISIARTKFDINKKFLIHEYTKNKKALLKISQLVRCNVGLIYFYLKKYNIKLRGYDHHGKNNPNYKHGLGHLPYSKKYTKELRRAIRKRDNYKCQYCGMTQEEHLQIWGRKIEIHHINYNKQNCKENNLITLCKLCNMKANSNRDYWFAYYTYIMENLNG